MGILRRVKKNCCSRFELKDQLRDQNSHKKYKEFRKIYALSKVNAYEIDEICSLDLAYVDKFPKQNAGVKTY